MSVSIWVGETSHLIGASSFLNAFFATVAVRAEEGQWGSRFPVLMNELYAGRLPSSDAARARVELAAIRDLLSRWQPTDVVWDAERPAARPPWGDDISDAVTSLADYFVTADGSPLIEVLDGALASADSGGLDVRIE